MGSVRFVFGGVDFVALEGKSPQRSEPVLGVGSFDSVSASLCETLIALRMTREPAQPLCGGAVLRATVIE
jgi:hypothetical protein